MTNEELCSKILEMLGGKDNVVSATHCMTRLRIRLKDDKAVHDKDIEELPGVMGVIHDDERYIEVVVGPGKSTKCAEILNNMGIPTGTPKEKATDSRIADWQSYKASVKSKQKESKLRTVLHSFGEIFAPLIPGTIVAGLCAGFATLLTQVVPNYADIGFWNVVYNLLSGINASFMTYITAWAGYRTAEKFGGTPILGGIAGMMATLGNIDNIAKIVGLYNEAQPLEAILRAGRGGVLATVIGVWIMCKVEKFVRKKLPDALDTVFTPLLTLFITLVPYVFLVMPATGFISGGICDLVEIVAMSSNPIVRMLAGYIGAALFLPMVAMGMHHGLVALYTVQLETFGYVTLYPALAMAGAGQVGTAIAIYLKSKRAGNKKMCRIIEGALPAGILGVGEPLIYGVTLPLGRPFITAGLGAGFGGAFVMFFEVASTTWGPAGVLGSFVMTQGPAGAAQSVSLYLVGLVISAVMGFILSWFVIKEGDLGKVLSEKRLGIKSPVVGRAVAMKDIPDKVFSSGTAGPCMGVDPADGRIYAPADGTVTVLSDTCHAFCMSSQDMEILVHVGIDTVKMKGQGFTPHVKVGDSVKAGDLILDVDLDEVRAQGHPTTVITALGNAGKFGNVEIIASEDVSPGDNIITVETKQ